MKWACSKEVRRELAALIKLLMEDCEEDHCPNFICEDSGSESDVGYGGEALKLGSSDAREIMCEMKEEEQSPGLD